MTNAFDSVTEWFSRHSATIATGASIIGLVSTVVLAVKATPEAHEIVLDARERLDNAKSETKAKKIKKEAVKDLTKCYLTTGISLGLTVTSIILSHKCSFATGERVGFGSAQLIANKLILDYRDAWRAEVGEKHEREVHERVLRKQYEDKGRNQPIVITGCGSYLCYDSACCVRFRADIGRVRNAITKINQQLQRDTEVSIADLYSEIGIPYGYAQENLFWDINKNGLIEEYYTSKLDNDTDEPMLVINYYKEDGWQNRR